MARGESAARFQRNPVPRAHAQPTPKPILRLAMRSDLSEEIRANIVVRGSLSGLSGSGQRVPGTHCGTNRKVARPFWLSRLSPEPPLPQPRERNRHACQATRDNQEGADFPPAGRLNQRVFGHEPLLGSQRR
jgi:hypothetical protein